MLVFRGLHQRGDLSEPLLGQGDRCRFEPGRWVPKLAQTIAAPASTAATATSPSAEPRRWTVAGRHMPTARLLPGGRSRPWGVWVG